MSSTTFIPQVTVIPASWLNDINTAAYLALGNGGAVPTTPAQALANIGGTTLVAAETAINAITQSGSLNFAVDSGAVNALAVTLSPAPSALIAGMPVRVGNVKASNTGATTLNVNALGALPVYGMGNAPLQGGELPAGADCVVVLDHAEAHWILVAVFGGALPVGAATQGNHAVTLTQLNASLGHATTGVYGIVILGTASNVSSGTAGVIPDAAAVNAASAGYGTLRDQTGARAFTTSYTNTSGRPMWVHIACIVSSGTVPAVLTINGLTIVGSASTGTNPSAVDGIVPPGGTYSLSPSGLSSISQWRELS